MDGFWTVGEISAVVGIVLAMMLHLGASLRFIYRMEGRVANVAEAVARVERELHKFRDDIHELAERAETILVIQESIRHLTHRLDRIENGKT